MKRLSGMLFSETSGKKIIAKVRVADTSFKRFKGLMLERGKNCRAFILPSWTDISPNQVYECLSIGLPVLATKENYLNIKDLLPEMIDPNSISDISKKLEKLADDAYYSDFVRRFKDISIKHDWDDVVKEHKNIFMQVQKNI